MKTKKSVQKIPNFRRILTKIENRPTDPEHTFDLFEQDGSNQFAFACAKAMSSTEYKKYLVLALWGKAGLGKTHLMNAMAAVLRKKKKKVIYFTNDTFCESLVAALKENKLKEFRRFLLSRYDALFFDDIDFLLKKETTFEELTNIAWDFVLNKKLVVLSSSELLNKCSNVPERFNQIAHSGLCADLLPLTPSGALKFIDKKANQINVTLPGSLKHKMATDGQGYPRVTYGKLLAYKLASMYNVIPGAN